MRASRLLHMLLLLQNRGKLTTKQLADELEVTRRTILRDLDALTEAGLPVLTHRGPQGGIELGFNYRTRLTGLDPQEAEAMALILARPMAALGPLGLASAGERARSKMLESFPDAVRAHMDRARAMFRFEAPKSDAADPRVEALAKAVRGRRIVRLQATTLSPRTVHPRALQLAARGWALIDACTDETIDESAWGNINISARTF